MTQTDSLAPGWLKVPTDLNHIDRKLWPETLRRGDNGDLLIGGVPAGQLAAQYGTPLMIMDKRDFFDRAKRVKAAFDNEAERIGTSAKVYYAGKSLLTTEIVKWVSQLGLNLDVSTGGELALALAGGLDGSRIGLHGNNKSLYEIGRAVDANVGAIVIDSEIEIERIASVAGAQDKIQGVRIRVNSGVHAHTHEYLATAREDQKFGIAIADVPDLVARIRSHSHLRFLGLHSHIGSQIFSVEGFLESVNRLLPLHKQLLEDGEVPELNLGGGFGINYTSADDAPEIEFFAEAISNAVATECAKLEIKVPILCFEPGRAISGPSGITLYNVGTTKDVVLSEQGSQVRKYVSIDGGMSDNARPSLYSADYSATLASRTSNADPALSRIVGKHCESGDIVVRDCYLPQDVAPNDLVAVAATGAYCHSLASNYNYVTRPAIVSVESGESAVLLRAETEADMFARDPGYRDGLAG
ncbi:MAG: diaminopimelate decarboxylase [Actinomycetota bacterium]